MNKHDNKLESSLKNKSDIGVIGLAVMGENLILNMASKGFHVACYNRSTDKVDDFIQGRAKGKTIAGYHSLEALCQNLSTPRKLMIMVKAGSAVDAVIDQIIPHLEPGDIIIDGGNSHFPDTIRRTEYIESKGLLFVGAGVSGGEEGALLGPSIMPGGSQQAWPHLKSIFQTISAKTDEGDPCCEWVGDNGAGHFVKMVHNGIEYGDMQMISETYHMMREGLGMSNEQMHDTFAHWNTGKLDSYLIEITADILGFRDENGVATLDLVLDAAKQKGTGKWTVNSALDEGMPLTLIAEAVFARALSSIKDERLEASQVLMGPPVLEVEDRDQLLTDLEDALYASKIISYAQGYQLLHQAAQSFGWNLKYGEIALMWRGGCIIRSAFLGKIKEAYDRNPGLRNLLLDPFFSDAVHSAQTAWRRVMTKAIQLGIPMPAMGSALAYFDGYRTSRSSANLIQAQRDYFGAHTYERVDRPRGEFFHTNWTGRGGATASSVYSV